MRLLNLALLFGVAGGYMALTACTTTTKPAGDDDDDDDDDDDSTNTGDDDDDDDDDDSTNPTGPTGDPVVIGFAGSATIGGSGTTYDGTEAIYIAEWLGPIPATATDLIDANIGPNLCEYTWQTVTGTPFSGGVACTDDAGTPCDFAFDLSASGSTETDGTDCATLFEGPLEDATFTYGMHSAFQYEYGSYLYDIGGPWLTYYSTQYTEWSPTTNLVTYSGGNFEYNWISQIGFLQPY